ncbi:MAG: hypothetical protein A3J60_02770 [Candidatus Pacebacteria bacterium RIFCSPHIGHO2_02_FULL_46_9]|nr:MAG: hypothetical protein A3J60_02770 [Candidatus Pacebacteria bacterium RIFCSPHIGHO2_02_FULL_46_9]
MAHELKRFLSYSQIREAQNSPDQESRVLDDLVRLLLTHVLFSKDNPFGFYSSKASDRTQVDQECFYALHNLLTKIPWFTDDFNLERRRKLRARLAVGVLSLFTTEELEKLFDHRDKQLRREYFYTRSQEYADLCMQVVADAMSFLPYKSIGLYRESSERVALAVRDAVATIDGQLPPYKLRQSILLSNSSDVLYEVWVVK